MYKHYLNMLCACYSDIASAHPAQNTRDHALDLALIRRRFRREGIAFLTKTLPSFGKAIDFALSSGTPLAIPNFGKKKGTILPRFLGWLVEEIFTCDGLERNTAPELEPDRSPAMSVYTIRRQAQALAHLRQLSYLFYKLEMPYDEQSISRVLRGFVHTDTSVGNVSITGDPQLIQVVRYARGLIRRVLGGVCPRDIVPKHGPGSVATGEKSPQKPYFVRDYVDATAYYPLDAYYYLNSSHVERCLVNNELHVRDERGKLRPWKTMETSTAKVVLVPKDSRGPRLISMEPLEIQWLQQGQCELLVKSIESHWLTAGHVNFKNQETNRFLAWMSSMPPSWRPSLWKDYDAERLHCALSVSKLGMNLPPPNGLSLSVGQTNWDYVTLDMKEASDRISLAHLSLFPETWIEALMATRSGSTRLPNGSEVILNKFAPMGSAVCFPVESLVFWALSLATIRYANPEYAKRNEGSKILRDLRRDVWVYGDDLIICRADYAAVKATLERTGLLLNENKCCLGRFFRESCGMDSYAGVNVTPLRIKQCLGSSRLSGQQLMSYVSYSNEAYRRGYHELANYLEEVVSSITKVPFTTVDRGYVQFVRPDADVKRLNKQRNIKTRFNSNLHILEAYGPSPRAVITDDHNVTWESYFSRYLSSHRDSGVTPPTAETSSYPLKDNLPISGRLEADQYSVPRRVTSNRGWKQITL